MKLKLAAFLLLSIFCSTNVFATSYAADTGKIKSLYISSNGNMAILLDNGFPNALAGAQCATANTSSWGGNLTADPAFKSALLAAKAAQQTITVTIQGCESNGAWFRIIDFYVN